MATAQATIPSPNWMEQANSLNGMGQYYAPAPAMTNTMGGAGDYSDPFNQYLAAIPLMQQNADREIGSAVASLAPGNRYSGEAFRQAGNIGANTSLAMNQQLLSTLYNQYNTSADRDLAASGMMLSASPMVENAMQSRYGAMSGALQDRMKAWEAQRAAAMSAARMRYSNFEQNKYGTLPMLMGALSTSIGQGPEPILSTSPGKTGYGSDILQLLASYYGGKG